jgi:two-component system CheB/CheR fusion protein
VASDPIGAPDPLFKEAGNSAPAGSHQPRVLLVEDHHDTAVILSRLLKNRGYEVKTAHSVESATDAATESFDLLISDLGLPDGSGLELMRRLQSRNINLAGIALSGFGTDQDVQRSREAGFTEHLTKPVDFQSIISAIERVMKDVVPSKSQVPAGGPHPGT